MADVSQAIIPINLFQPAAGAAAGAARHSGMAQPAGGGETGFLAAFSGAVADLQQSLQGMPVDPVLVQQWIDAASHQSPGSVNGLLAQLEGGNNLPPLTAASGEALLNMGLLQVAPEGAVGSADVLPPEVARLLQQRQLQTELALDQASAPGSAPAATALAELMTAPAGNASARPLVAGGETPADRLAPALAPIEHQLPQHDQVRLAETMAELQRAIARGAEVKAAGPVTSLGGEAAIPLVAPAATMTVVAPQMAHQPPTVPIQVPVNHPDWGAELGSRLVWMAKQDQQVAEIKLNPPHLGPLEVRVTINQDQASVVFASQHALTRDAIETALPRLREMLAEQGLNLADADVSSQSFAEQRREERGEGQAIGGARDDDGNSTEPSSVTIGDAGERRGEGLLDTFA